MRAGAVAQVGQPLTYLFFVVEMQVSVVTFFIEVADDFLRRVLAETDDFNTSKVRVLAPIGMLDCIINHFVEVEGEKPGKPGNPTPKSRPVDCLVFLDKFVGGGDVLLVVLLESLSDGFRVDTQLGVAQWWQPRVGVLVRVLYPYCIRFINPISPMTACISPSLWISTPPLASRSLFSGVRLSCSFSKAASSLLHFSSISAALWSISWS